MKKKSGEAAAVRSQERADSAYLCNVRQKERLLDAKLMKADECHAMGETVQELDWLNQVYKLRCEIANMSAAEEQTFQLIRADDLKQRILMVKQTVERELAAQSCSPDSSTPEAENAMRSRASQKEGTALPTDSKYVQKEEREREYLSRTIYKPIPPYTLKDFAGKPLISLSEIFSTTPVLDYFLKLQGHSTILLHGSPGTGKTFFVECFAGEIADRNPKYKYISCSSADIMDSSLGVSETRVRMLFKEIEKSRPCVCLLDEIEALIPCRNKEKQEYSVRITDEFLLGLNQLINENKKPENMKNDRQVIFFGATNHTNMVDEAALSRFYQITVPLPDMEQRKSVLHSCLENMVSLDDDLTFEEMADLTEGFSHRDLNHLKNDIAEAIKEKILNRYSSQEEMIQALQHGRERLARADFEKALKTATPPELTKKLQAV